MDDLVFADSSFIVDHLRGRFEASRILTALIAKRQLILHPVVLAEVLAGARDRQHLAQLDATLVSVPVASVKSSDFVAAIELLRAHRLSCGADWPDCLIAATAIRLGRPLITSNEKHFRPMRGLRVVRPY